MKLIKSIRADKLNRNDEIFEFLLSSGAKCDDCDEWICRQNTNRVNFK